MPGWKILAMKEAERSFADLEWENKKHKNRREKFLERMEVVTPLL